MTTAPNTEVKLLEEVYYDLSLQEINAALIDLAHNPDRKLVILYHKEINSHIMKRGTKILQSGCEYPYEKELEIFIFDELVKIAIKKHFTEGLVWDLQFFKSERHMHLYFYRLLCSAMYEENDKTIDKMIANTASDHEIDQFARYKRMVVALYDVWYKIFKPVYDSNLNKNH